MASPYNISEMHIWSAGEVLCNLNQNYCKLKQKEEGQRSIDMDRKVLDVKDVGKARGYSNPQHNSREASKQCYPQTPGNNRRK